MEEEEGIEDGGGILVFTLAGEGVDIVRVLELVVFADAEPLLDSTLDIFGRGFMGLSACALGCGCGGGFLGGTTCLKGISGSSPSSSSSSSSRLRAREVLAGLRSTSLSGLVASSSSRSMSMS